jgi:hypothetical protein
MDIDPMTGRPVKKPTSPWVWVAIGCGGVVVLAIIAFLAFGWMAFRAAKDMEEGFKDPVKREQKSKEVIAYQQLPPGYYPAGAIKIPFLLEMAIFSDRELGAGETPDEHDLGDKGFMFFNMRQMGGNKEDLRRFLRGEEPREQTWRTNVDYRPGEVIGMGSVEVKGSPVLYHASRGRVSFGASASHGEGLVTMLMPDCPGDKRVRFGFWFTPDETEGKPVAEADFKGTSADPEAIKDFLGYFEVCPEKR